MKSLNILVIDDELFICEMITDMLQDKGHKITATIDSREGLQFFEKNAYDVVFTNYQMPHLNGIELARRMKALKPEVPICFLTASAGELQPDELANFAVVVEKPFASEDLTNAIEQALPTPSDGTEKSGK